MADTVNSPLDLIGIYLTPQIGVGQTYKLETIQRRLGSLPLDRTIDVLSQLAYRADKTIRPEEAAAFAQNILRPTYAKKAIDLINSKGKERYYVTSSQVVIGLALQALVYCSEEDQGIDDQTLVNDLAELLLSLGGLFESQSQNRDSVLMSLVRLDIWHRTNDVDAWHELAYRIVFDTLPNLKNGSKNWIDSRKLVEEKTGLDLEIYWALTNAMAVYADSDPTGYLFPHYLDSSVLSKEQVDKWTNFFTVNLEEARAKAAEDIQDTGLWTFGTFYETPLVQLQNKIVCMRPWFLTMKATPLGYFNTVDHLNRADYLKWSRLFGEAIEELGRALINEHIPNIKCLSEQEIKNTTGSGKVCDCILIDKDWAALDFVYRRLSKPTSTTGDLDDLARDLERGVFEKLEQIDESVVKVLAYEELERSIYPLVVVGNPFPVNGLLLEEIDKWVLSNTKLKVIGKDRRCKEPLIMDLAEFWNLLEWAEYNNLTPANLLEQWSSSPLKVTNFRNWLVTSNLLRKPLEKPRRYHSQGLKYLFGKDI